MTGPDWRPPHAYQPGRTPRHPEDLFDPIRDGTDAHAPDRLRDAPAWRFGLAFLEDGFYWEAHEVLEAVWLACPPNSAEKALVQGVIQTANAALKRQMGQSRAAARLAAIATGLLDEGTRRGGHVTLKLDTEYISTLRTLAAPPER